MFNPDSEAGAREGRPSPGRAWNSEEMLQLPTLPAYTLYIYIYIYIYICMHYN